ncbi:MAG: DUF302 domain-containing protein [Bacteroidales bacterium]|nr:DUF302 domain-containing protein [Bacteroidales bacterium]
MTMKSFVIEKKSRLGFDETVDRLIKEAEQREWKVPFIHDLQQSLAKSGKTVNPVKVIEICKPAYSGQMLELNDERIMSVMMPCRISVYMKDDGETYTAILDGSALSSGQPDRIAAVMQAASDETFEIVRSILK